MPNYFLLLFFAFVFYLPIVCLNGCIAFLVAFYFNISQSTVFFRSLNSIVIGSSWYLTIGFH